MTTPSPGDLVRRYVELDRQYRELESKYVNMGNFESPPNALDEAAIAALTRLADERDAAQRAWFESMGRPQGVSSE